MSGTPTTDHAHDLCTEVHESGPFADGRPHCVECGQVPLVIEVVQVTEVEVPAEPIFEAIGIVLRLAKRLDGMTVHEMNLMYGEGLAEVFADAQAWAVKN